MGYMKDEIISFETAKLLQEKIAFNFKINSWYSPSGELNTSPTKGIDFSYSNGIPAPTQSLLQRILREGFRMDIMIEPFDDENGGTSYEPTIFWDAFDEDEDDEGWEEDHELESLLSESRYDEAFEQVSGYVRKHVLFEYV